MSTFDIDLLVERRLIAREVEIGGEVDRARDLAAVFSAQLAERLSERLRRGQVDRDERNRRLLARPVETDQRVVVRERFGQR